MIDNEKLNTIEAKYTSTRLKEIIEDPIKGNFDLELVKGVFIMAQTSINIRMDEELKKQVEYLFSEFGMNMTTAFTIFAKAVVREKRIPFEISAATDDFYNEYNQDRIKKAMADIKAGKGVAHELIQVSDE